MSYKTLYESVIHNQLCCFCGACVAVCPENSLAFFGQGPKLVNPCAECGTCIAACPGYGAPLMKLNGAILGRQLTKDEEKRGLGAIIEDRNLISADPEILHHGYTGGKVTALLTYLLEKGLIDGAIVSACGDSTPYPHFAWPKIATTKKELVHCAGSKYMFSPNLLALKEAAENDKLRSIAFVGTGCQVMSIRKMQLMGPAYERNVDKISYVFGLFCGAAMVSADDFMRLVAKLCAAPPEDIVAIDFHRVSEQSKFIVEYEVRLKNGAAKSRKILIDDLFFMISLLDQWNRCRMCMDYASEWADISFGGAHIISRTAIGEQLMQDALADEILVSSKENEFWQAFEQNAHKTDSNMIRLKKAFNRRRISKNKSKRNPVPEFGENVSEI